MGCKDCTYVVFSERRVEGAPKLGTDSVGGVQGSLYLIDRETVDLLKSSNAVTDRGRLARII